jgi:hypothetical protein
MRHISSPDLGTPLAGAAERVREPQAREAAPGPSYVESVLFGRRRQRGSSPHAAGDGKARVEPERN